MLLLLAPVVDQGLYVLMKDRLHVGKVSSGHGATPGDVARPPLDTSGASLGSIDRSHQFPKVRTIWTAPRPMLSARPDRQYPPNCLILSPTQASQEGPGSDQECICAILSTMARTDCGAL